MKDAITRRRVASLYSAVEPIVRFLEQDSVIEIMLNSDGKVWVDEAGKGMYCTDTVMSQEDAERMIRLIAASMNTEIHEKNPSLAARMPIWGARLQACVPPVVSSPVFSLRKPAKFIFSLEDYVRQGILSEAQAIYLDDSVKSRKNLLIGGGTGSGKTTLANALLHSISSTKDRVYIVEDNPELQCSAENMVQVLVQPPLYTHRQAIMDALRLRPDRIIVGEVRDGAALDMLKAWNTGHPGGLATIHANSAAAMLQRLCQLIEEVVPSAPRELIGEAIDVCVHIQRDPRHPAGRALSGIIAVNGFDKNSAWVLEPFIEHT
jgi:type IV secretion system protein VirB11